MRVLYMGSPDFAVPPLELLLEAGHEIVGVVSLPPRKAGRGRRLVDPRVALAARRLGLRLFQPEKASARESREVLRPLRVDVAVTAAYGQYLGSRFLALPRHGVLNIHPSLLPRFRGASPVMSFLLSGEELTGVSILRSVKKMDAGPILARQEVVPGARETAGELTARLFVLGGELLASVLARLASGPVDGTPQDEALASSCARVSKEDAHICWEDEAAQIARQVRAFNPWPVAWTRVGSRQLRIWRAAALEAGAARPSDTTLSSEPAGTLLGPPAVSRAQVVCARGRLLLQEVQLEGSTRMPAEAALRGLRLDRGRCLLEAHSRGGG